MLVLENQNFLYPYAFPSRCCIYSLAFHCSPVKWCFKASLLIFLNSLLFTAHTDTPKKSILKSEVARICCTNPEHHAFT